MGRSSIPVFSCGHQITSKSQQMPMPQATVIVSDVTSEMNVFSYSSDFQNNAHNVPVYIGSSDSHAVN